jgi:hypothetical protein
MPANPHPTALGMALPSATRGPQATILFDRVEPAAARSVSIPVGQVPGYAIAHEIGHILLRSKDHSAAGIMSRAWSSSEWRSVSAGTLGFTPQEADRMIRVVGASGNRGLLPQEDCKVRGWVY